MATNGSLEFRLLGRFVVLGDGREIPPADFAGRKARTLLCVLTTRRGSFVSHEQLTEALWGSRPPVNPAANLQVLVNRARRALGRPDVVLTGPGGYALSDDASCVVDAEQFLAAVERARAAAGRAALDAYLSALSLWGGEPLAEDRYSDWSGDYRARLLAARQAALEAAADLALHLGEPVRAVDLAAAAAAAEPLREAAVLGHVRALAAVGDNAAALARYDAYRRALADELGVDPSAGAQQVQAELLRGGGGPTPTRPRRSPGTEFAELQFVGRAREFAELVETAGRADLVILEGPPGSGKSRLLRRLADSVAVITVRAFLAEQNEPWSLARSMVREVLAADARAGADFPAPLKAALHWLLPEAEIGAENPVPARTDPQSRRALLVEATVRLLADAGDLLVVDDLQWADATSLSLLEATIARLASSVGAVLAVRPAEASDRPEVADLLERLRPAARLVSLQPLSEQDIGALVDDPALAAQLAERTDGSPLAVAEVLHALDTEGRVSRSQHNRWRPADAAALERAGDLADEGQSRSILTRADAEPQVCREVLELLALLGREAPARVLALASGTDERTVLDRLAALARHGLVRLGERGWAPAHDLVAEAIARRLVPDEAGRLHGALATALAAEDTDAGELARHWLGAGDAARAAQAYCRAAAAAVAGFAHPEAESLASTGLELMPTGELAAELAEIRAEARARIGDIAGARADLHSAMSVHRRGPVRSRLLGRLATLASGADDLVRAAELAEVALVEAGTDPAARARALGIAAVLDMNLDRADRAEQRASEAMQLYQRLGDANGTAQVLDGRAMATFLDGEVARGTDLLARAADLFEDSGDLLHVVTPRSTAGHGRVFGGDAAGGLRLTTAALDLARTLGHSEGEAYALWHTAEALTALGDAAAATDAAREALEIAVRVGHRGWTATAYRALGIAAQAAGDDVAALGFFEESLAMCEHLNLFASWAAARAARVLVRLGRVDEAAARVERALSEGPPLGHFEARLAQVELAAARGEAETVALARAALQRADAAGVRQDRERLVRLSGT